MSTNADFDLDYIPELEAGGIRGLMFAFLAMAGIAAVVVGTVYGIAWLAS